MIWSQTMTSVSILCGSWWVKELNDDARNDAKNSVRLTMLCISKTSAEDGMVNETDKAPSGLVDNEVCPPHELHDRPM